jgi:hypothetical protein
MNFNGNGLFCHTMSISNIKMLGIIVWTARYKPLLAPKFLDLPPLRQAQLWAISIILNSNRL